MAKNACGSPAGPFRLSRGADHVPGLAEAHELVPEIDHGYVFEKTPLAILRAWWMSATREPLYIHGPWGCGKTSSVEQFFARLNVPVVPIMGRDPMEKADLVGMYVLGGERGWNGSTGRRRSPGATATCC